MATMRLFIAIELPAGIRNRIANVARELKSANADVRWEQSGQFHLTLYFLGDTDEAQVADIILALKRIAQSTRQCSMRFSALGCFPVKKEPRIIWIGIENSDSALAVLAESVDQEMSGLGFEKQGKRFHPHITLGRVKSQRNMPDLLRKMESLTFESQSIAVSEIVLVKSELKPSGSIYTILKKIPFLSH